MAEAKIILRAEDKASPDIKKVNDSVKGLSDSVGSLNSIGSSLTKIGTGLTAGITAPIIAAGTALTALVANTGAAADAIDKMSERTGISRRSLQELQYAASQTGVDFKALDGISAAFSGRLQQVESGTGAAAEAFESLGLSTTTASGDLKTSGEIFEETITALAGIEDEAERGRAAIALLGPEGAKLAPLLNQGADGIDALRARAHELGVVLDDETISSLVGMQDAVDDVKKAFGGLGNDIVTEFAPIIRDSVIPLLKDEIVPALRGVAEEISNIIKWFVDLDESQKRTIGAIATALAVSGPLLVGIGNLLRAISGIKAGLLALKPALLLLTMNPVGLMVGVVAGLTAIGGAMFFNNRNSAAAAAAGLADSISGNGQESVISALDEMIASSEGDAKQALVDLRAELIQTGDVAINQAGRMAVYINAIDELANRNLGFVGASQFAGLGSVVANLFSDVSDLERVLNTVDRVTGQSEGSMWALWEDAIANQDLYALNEIVQVALHELDRNQTLFARYGFELRYLDELRQEIQDAQADINREPIRNIDNPREPFTVTDPGTTTPAESTTDSGSGGGRTVPVMPEPADAAVKAWIESIQNQIDIGIKSTEEAVQTILPRFSQLWSRLLTLDPASSEFRDVKDKWDVLRSALSGWGVEVADEFGDAGELLATRFGDGIAATASYVERSEGVFTSVGDALLKLGSVGVRVTGPMLDYLRERFAETTVETEELTQAQIDLLRESERASDALVTRYGDGLRATFSAVERTEGGFTSVGDAMAKLSSLGITVTGPMLELLQERFAETEEELTLLEQAALDSHNAQIQRAKEVQELRYGDGILATFSAVQRTEGAFTSVSDAMLKLGRAGVTVTGPMLEYLQEQFEENTVVADRLANALQEATESAQARNRANQESSIGDGLAYTISLVERSEGAFTSVSDAVLKLGQAGVTVTGPMLEYLEERFAKSIALTERYEQALRDVTIAENERARAATSARFDDGGLRATVSLLERSYGSFTSVSDAILKFGQAGITVTNDVLVYLNERFAENSEAVNAVAAGYAAAQQIIANYGYQIEGLTAQQIALINRESELQSALEIAQQTYGETSEQALALALAISLIKDEQTELSAKLAADEAATQAAENLRQLEEAFDKLRNNITSGANTVAEFLRLFDGMDTAADVVVFMGNQFSELINIVKAAKLAQEAYTLAVVAGGTAMKIATMDIIGLVIQAVAWLIQLFSFFGRKAREAREEAARQREEELAAEQEAADALAAIYDGLAASINGSMRQAFRDLANSTLGYAESMEAFKKSFKQAVYDSVLDGIIDAIIQAAIMEAVLKPYLEQIAQMIQDGNYADIPALFDEMGDAVDQVLVDLQPVMDMVYDFGVRWREAIEPPDLKDYLMGLDKVEKGADNFGQFVSQAVSIPLFDAAIRFEKNVDRFGAYITSLIDQGIQVHATSTVTVNNTGIPAYN